MYRDGVAKVKVYLELKLACDVKINKKGLFYLCWQPSRVWSPQLNDAVDVETKDMHRVAD